MRVLLIHNPKSGEGDLSEKKLVGMIERAGHEVVYRSIKKEGLEKVLDDTFDLVAVAGGDGSVGKMAARMIGRNMPMTILSMGTANNVARTMGLNLEPRRAVESWNTARRIPVDIGVARGYWGERFFLEAVGSGLFTHMMTFVDDERHEHIDRKIHEQHGLKGYVRLLKTMLEAFHPRAWRLRLDGVDYSGKYLLWEAMNIRCIGPNLALAPEANPSDGFLDVVLVTEEDKNHLVDHLDQHLEEDSPGDYLPVRKARVIEIDWEGGELHLDDLSWPAEEEKSSIVAGRIEISLQSHVLEFLVPQESFSPEERYGGHPGRRLV